MTDWKKHKEYIMMELARLDELDWGVDSKVAESIFPYVLVEAVNILKNSVIIANPIDYTTTGEAAKALMAEAKKGSNGN